MKKIIYFIGICVVALNLFFNLSPENTIDIANANADGDRICDYDLGRYDGYSEVLLNNCYNPGGLKCGKAVSCVAGSPWSRCYASTCYVYIGFTP